MKPQHLLAAGIVLGVAAVVMLNFYVRSRIGAIQKKSEAVEILTMKQNLSAGKLLAREHVIPAKVPSEYVAALGDPIKPKDLPLVEGKAVRKRAYKGQFVVWSMFEERTEQGRPDSLDRILPPGMRLLCVPVTTAGTAKGWVRPGDMVDLAGTFRGAAADETWVFLEKVKVVATGGVTAYADGGRAQSRGYGDITVLLNPTEALKAVHAIENASRIQVLLRNPADEKPLTEEARGISQPIFQKMRPRQLRVEGTDRPGVVLGGQFMPPAIGGEPTPSTTQ